MAQYDITVTTTALHITDSDEVNCTAAGEFSYRKNNEQVELAPFAGQGVTINFGEGDTATVNGGGTLSTADTLIAALDAIVTA